MRPSLAFRPPLALSGRRGYTIGPDAPQDRLDVPARARAAAGGARRCGPGRPGGGRALRSLAERRAGRGHRLGGAGLPDRLHRGRAAADALPVAGRHRPRGQDAARSRRPRRFRPASDRPGPGPCPAAQPPALSSRSPKGGPAAGGDPETGGPRPRRGVIPPLRGDGEGRGRAALRRLRRGPGRGPSRPAGDGRSPGRERSAPAPTRQRRGQGRPRQRRAGQGDQARRLHGPPHGSPEPALSRRGDRARPGRAQDPHHLQAGLAQGDQRLRGARGGRPVPGRDGPHRAQAAGPAGSPRAPQPHGLRGVHGPGRPPGRAPGRGPARRGLLPHGRPAQRALRRPDPRPPALHHPARHRAHIRILRSRPRRRRALPPDGQGRGRRPGGRRRRQRPAAAAHRAPAPGFARRGSGEAGRPARGRALPGTTRPRPAAAAGGSTTSSRR